MAEQSVAEEWLPPGWTAEIRVRKNGKKDRHGLDGNPVTIQNEFVGDLNTSKCYTDPSKEHKFNSKPEVLRYLKSIESIPGSEGKRRSSRNRTSLVSPAVPEQENLEDSRTNGKKISNQIAELVETFKDEKILECTGGEENLLLDQKEKNETINSVCNSAILRDSPPQNMPGVEENGNKRLEISNNYIKSKNNNKGTDLPRRASKRLAGVEVGPVPELSPNNRTRRVSMRRVNDTDAAATSNNLLHVNNKDNNLLTEISHEKCDDVVCSTLEVPFKDFLMDPCIEFAIKTLTGEITIEDELGKNKEPIKVPEPSVESSFGDLWGDPCIEFAVKTLTGDIPFDDLNFQSYFKKREKGSDFSLASGSVSNSDGSLTSNFSQNGNGNNSFACRR